jgi:hypothetical protein
MARQLIRFVVAAGLVLAGAPHSAWAQSNPALPVVAGSKVRIEAPAVLAGRFVGTVKEIDDQSVLIEVADQPAIRVPRQAITQLDVSDGRRRQFLQGAMIGAGIGAVLFAIEARAYSGAGVGGMSAVAGQAMVGGAIWGVGIGALIKKDHWIAVPMAPVPVSSTAARGRKVLTLASVRF